jgi:hypothetical protein
MSKIRLDLKASPTRLEAPSVTRTRAPERGALQSVRTYLNLLVSVPAVVALLYVGSVLYNDTSVIPKGVQTIQDFYRRYGEPPQVETISADGRTFYRVIGEIQAPLAFPKGHPEYIFDATGRLIDWSGAVGNDPEFRTRWQSARATPMTVGYFLEKFPRN